jgi:hypothetical protein
VYPDQCNVLSGIRTGFTVADMAALAPDPRERRTKGMKTYQIAPSGIL